MQNFFIFFIFLPLCSVSLRKNGGKKNLFYSLTHSSLILLRQLVVFVFFVSFPQLYAGLLRKFACE